MTLRDRGKMKWQFAFGMPELIKGQRYMWRDTERIAKPIIDEYEAEEFEQRICYAMQNNLAIKLTVWIDEFTKEVNGRIHSVDPLTKEIRFKVNSGELERINIKDVLEVVVLD